MRVLHIFLLAIFSFHPLQALAEESPFTGGMHHTFVQSKNYTAKNKINDDLKTENSEAEERKKQIWDKYKALAAGKAEEAEEASPANAEPEEQTKQIAQPTGMTGLLRQYQSNKAQRSNMRSLTVQNKSLVKTTEKPE